MIFKERTWAPPAGLIVRGFLVLALDEASRSAGGAATGGRQSAAAKPRRWAGRKRRRA